MTQFSIEGITPADLEQFEEHGYSDEDALDQAQALLLEAVPNLPRIYAELSPTDRKTARFAVLEMAKYLKLEFDRFERSTSPFQSETLGSYSYSRMSQNIRQNSSTNIPAFDRAVQRFRALLALMFPEEGDSYASSEQVFKVGFDSYRSSREVGEGLPAVPYNYAYHDLDGARLW